jgi:hypothetical protein
MCGQALVKVMVKPYLNPSDPECLPKLLPRIQNSPKQLKIYLYESCPVCRGTQLSCRMAFPILSGRGWKAWSTDSASCSLTQIGIQSWQASFAKSVEKNPILPL